MEIFTKEQKLLKAYLETTDMVLASRAYMLGILWEEDATIEMLEYIARTLEDNPAKLNAVAEEISKKYPRSYEEEYYEED